MGDNWYQFAVAAVDEGPLCATGGIRLMTDGGPELLARGYDRGPRLAASTPGPEALCAALARPRPRMSDYFYLFRVFVQPTGATPRRCSPFPQIRWWRMSFTWAMLC